MKITSAVLLFFGITLVYTGYLVSGSGRSLTAGIVIVCAGLALIVKPALDTAKRYNILGGGAHSHRPRILQKLRGKKVHLKIVKSENDKPTIH